METINGVSFEDYALAAGNLSQGMPEAEVLQILGIEKPVWEDTNARWGTRLGELMMQDMQYAARYGEIFANPRQGKFAGASGGQTAEELLHLVPDLDTYQKIFWHCSVAEEHGVDSNTVLREYGLDLGKWSALSMHYSKQGLNTLDVNAPDYNEQFEYYSEQMDRWENYWRNFYSNERVDAAGDIEF